MRILLCILFQLAVTVSSAENQRPIFVNGVLTPPDSSIALSTGDLIAMPAGFSSVIKPGPRAEYQFCDAYFIYSEAKGPPSFKTELDLESGATLIYDSRDLFGIIINGGQVDGMPAPSGKGNGKGYKYDYISATHAKLGVGFWEELKVHDEVRFLRIPFSNASVESVQASWLSCLAVLDLHGCRKIGNRVFDKLITASPTLRSLDLSSTGIDGDLPESVSEYEELQVLLLAGNGITNMAIEKIAGLSQLKRLNIADTLVDGEGVRKLMDHGSLSALNISGLRDIDMNTAESIGMMSMITELDVSFTDFNDDMLWAAIDGKSMVKLSINSTKVSKGSVEKLVDSPSLRYLTVDKSQSCPSIRERSLRNGIVLMEQ